jgi:signal transduction histidine kinase
MNIRQHLNCFVTIEATDNLTNRVHDNGKGIIHAQTKDNLEMCLKNNQKRMSTFGGSFIDENKNVTSDHSILFSPLSKLFFIL